LAGCHRRTSEASWQKLTLVSTARDGAAVQLRHLLAKVLKTTAVYLVRSFRTYARIRSLTTGTFNRVVKDRIAFRLSGAPSVLDGLATRANPAVLETLQTYVAAQDPVNASIPQYFHLISTMGIERWNPLRSDAGERNAHLQRATVWPSAWDCKDTETRRMPKRKTKNWIKNLLWRSLL
jgi:hypothetical protein